MFEIVRLTTPCKFTLFRTSESTVRRQTTNCWQLKYGFRPLRLHNFLSSGYIYCVLRNVAHRQSEKCDTQMNQNRIYCKHRSVHLVVVSVVRIHAALLRANMG